MTDSMPDMSLPERVASVRLPSSVSFDPVPGLVFAVGASPQSGPFDGSRWRLLEETSPGEWTVERVPFDG